MEQPAPKLPMPIRATPYKHQIEAFNFVCGKFGLVPANGMASSGAALLMEMGTGKTITSIAVTGALYQAGRLRRVLVVAPLSILGVWDEEFAKLPKSRHISAAQPSWPLTLKPRPTMPSSPRQTLVTNWCCGLPRGNV